MFLTASRAVRSFPRSTKDSGYLARKNFEITDQSGRIITSGAVSADVLAQLRSGKLLVRQRPGPTNSLGLVKFMFPNEHNVYLHSTPSQAVVFGVAARL